MKFIDQDEPAHEAYRAEVIQRLALEKKQKHDEAARRGDFGIEAQRKAEEELRLETQKFYGHRNVLADGAKGTMAEAELKIARALLRGEPK